eukprot:scaffold63226_cov32-Prasinocladus_malaysianus.AAC.1
MWKEAHGMPDTYAGRYNGLELPLGCEEEPLETEQPEEVEVDDDSIKNGPKRLDSEFFAMKAAEAAKEVEILSPARQTDQQQMVALSPALPAGSRTVELSKATAPHTNITLPVLITPPAADAQSVPPSRPVRKQQLVIVDPRSSKPDNQPDTIDSAKPSRLLQPRGHAIAPRQDGLPRTPKLGPIPAGPSRSFLKQEL